MHVTVQSIYTFMTGQAKNTWKYLELDGSNGKREKIIVHVNINWGTYHLYHVNQVMYFAGKQSYFEPENVVLLSAVSLWEQCHTLSKEQLWLHEISHIPKFTCHFLYHNKEFLYRIPFTCIMINVNRRPKQREIFRNKDHYCSYHVKTMQVRNKTLKF